MRNAPETDLADLEIHPLQRQDEADVVELMRLALYGRDFPDLPGYWRWKHYDNPFGESFGLVARAGDQIVAVRAFMNWHLCGGGRLLRVGRAVDMAVHPEWRRRGVFERMTLALLEPMTAEGLVLTFNTPNAMSLAGYLKMGWAHPGRLPLRVKIRRPLRTTVRVGRTLLTRVIGGGVSQGGGGQALQGNVDNSRVLRLLRDPAVVELVQRAREAQLVAISPRSTAFRLRTALGQEYLEWHYGKNRWYPYAATYEAQGPAAALVIGRLRQRAGLVELLLTEVVTCPGRRGRALVARAAARLARETRADYLVTSALGGTPGALRGYIPVGRRGVDVTVRLLESTLTVDPSTWAGWAAGIGDFELF